MTTYSSTRIGISSSTLLIGSLILSFGPQNIAKSMTERRSNRAARRSQTFHHSLASFLIGFTVVVFVMVSLCGTGTNGGGVIPGIIAVTSVSIGGGLCANGSAVRGSATLRSLLLVNQPSLKLLLIDLFHPQVPAFGPSYLSGEHWGGKERMTSPVGVWRGG